MPHWFIDSSNSIKDDTSGGGQGYAFGLGLNDSLYIFNTGYIVETAASSDAVHVNNTAVNCQVTVDGLIYGTKAGIENLGLGTIIEVSGKVEGGVTGIVNWNGGQIEVSGKVIGGSGGTGIFDSGSGQIVVDSGGSVEGGFALDLGNGSSLLNNGTIANFANFGIKIDGGTVTNNGLISGPGNSFYYSGEAAETIRNTGTIQGGIGLSGSGGYIVINNSGLWTGDFLLTSNGDSVINTGRIDGNIYLGDGFNTLDTRYGIVTGYIDCGNGGNNIQAGAEDDVIFLRAGADTVDGGSGVDTIDYTSSGIGVKVNLSTGLARGGDAQGDRLSNIENVKGSSSNDVLIGGDGNNLLQGYFGHDRINGNGGDDTIIENGTDTATLNGGAGNDLFFLSTADAVTYGYAFSASSQVNGGSGDDTLEIRNAPSAVQFGATTVMGIEHIVADDGFNYHFTSNNATVAAGQSLEVDGSGLTGAFKIFFDGSAETDGTFVLEGGSGIDTFIGGAGADTLAGGGKGDLLTGGGGADVFSYEGASDSIFTTRDTITGLDANADTFQFDHKITAVGSTISGSVSTAADIQTLVSGHLPANSAVLVSATGGTLSGHTFLIVDENGSANYQSAGDFCIDVTGMTGTLTATDFIV